MKGFDDPIEHSFDFNHKGVANLTLWVVPFNIAYGIDDKNKLHLPVGYLGQNIFAAHVR
jgi:exonuclease V gamma subunit